MSLNPCSLQPSSAGQKPLRFIDSPAALGHSLQELRAYDTIAFDLEFDSHNRSYGVTLCLIQIATPDACYVIDPFAPVDLRGLYDLFEDERIRKIVHSPGEDLRLLHALQCYPKNLFDTEIVARLLNYEQTSLAVMMQEKLGYAMSKQQQRSNWLRRPLAPEQLDYAAADVAWLHPLRAVLEEEATQKGLMPFVLEEQAALTTTIYRPEVKTFFLKPADLYTLSPYEQHVLNALFVYRDELAQERNKPAFQIMDESLLRALAGGTLLPRDIPDAKGLYGGFKNSRFADRLSDQLGKIRAEADSRGLAHEVPPRQRLSAAGRAAREVADQDRDEKFVPVQQALAARFGTHAARFMLSNGQVNELLKGTLTISTLKHHYRQVLIRDIAAELDIDLSAYE